MFPPPSLGRLELEPAAARPDLMADPVRARLDEQDAWVGDVWVAAIDPALSDTAAFCVAYDVPLAASANCVVVTGRRGGEQRWAAALVLATTRADVNGVVRRRLDVRKVSFAPTEAAVAETGMEFGGITPIGLPADWPVLIDRAVVNAGLVVIGSGLRASKIALQGKLLAALPGAEVVDGLAG